jgi:hypothetical protein
VAEEAVDAPGTLLVDRRDCKPENNGSGSATGNARRMKVNDRGGIGAKTVGVGNKPLADARN